MATATDKKGLKRICAGCGVRFYDFNKRPILCPGCDAEFVGDIKIKGRRGRTAVATAVANDEKTGVAGKKEAVIAAAADEIEKEEKVKASDIEAQDDVISPEDMDDSKEVDDSDDADSLVVPDSDIVPDDVEDDDDKDDLDVVIALDEEEV